MTLLYWNPISITYLSQLIMVLVILAILPGTLRRPEGAWAVPTTTRFLLASFAFYAAYIALSFFGEVLNPRVQDWVEPIIAVMSSAAVVTFLQFAYRLEPKLAHQATKSRLAAGLSAAFILGEIGYMIYRFTLLQVGQIEFRPAYFDLPLLVTMIWVFVVAGRKIALESSTRRHDKLANVEYGNARSQDGSAARALIGYLIFPLMLAVVTALQGYHLIGIEVAGVASTLLSLGTLLGALLLYLNHFAASGSFSIKLNSAALASILGVFSSVAWMISAEYTGAARNAASELINQTIVFTPTLSGGYSATREEFKFEEVDPRDRLPGAVSIQLPFDFPFFAKPYREIQLREDGMVGFSSLPLWRDTVFGYGAQPAIFPLAVELDNPAPVEPEQNGLFAMTLPDRLTVTWLNLPDTDSTKGTYTFQMTLLASGEIRLSYRDIPKQIHHDLQIANRSPMIMGITPGFLSGKVQQVHFASGLPVTALPATGLIEDFRLVFLEETNRIYAPIAWLIVGASLVTSLMFQALFRFAFVRPLNSLLNGVQQFRGGLLDQQLPVHFPDEIGYLTRSFNEMAKTQNDQLQGLEEYVAERTAQVAILADRSARLEERSRISSDLHDAVSQTLFSAVLIADTLPRIWNKDPPQGEKLLADIASLNRSALQEMRTLLTRMRAPELAVSTLGALLGDLVERFETNRTLKITLSVGTDGQLAEDVLITFYRIAQEALNNVIKHASAENTRVFYEALPGQAILTVEDDGAGFDTELQRPGSLGLQIMAERARKIGATCEVRSSIGLGTQITLIWNRNDD